MSSGGNTGTNMQGATILNVDPECRSFPATGYTEFSDGICYVL